MKEQNPYNIFYKSLTKKIQKMSNKWQLHLYKIDEKKMTPFEFKDKFSKKPVKQFISMKPIGLYTSGLYKSNKDNIFWTNFLGSEMPEWLNPLNLKYFILKFDNKDILQINNDDDLQKFREKYEVKEDKYFYINWKEVAKSYKGINIKPFQHKHRNILWYSSFDCSSQCIWDASAIKDIKELDIKI